MPNNQDQTRHHVTYSYIIQDKTQLYHCNDAYNKCIATNVLAKLIFQDHIDQKSGLFQDQ